MVVSKAMGVMLLAVNLTSAMFVVLLAIRVYNLAVGIAPGPPLGPPLFRADRHADRQRQGDSHPEIQRPPGRDAGCRSFRVLIRGQGGHSPAVPRIVAIRDVRRVGGDRGERSESSFRQQRFPESHRSVGIDLKHPNGGPANGRPPDQHRAIPAKMPCPSMATGME